MGWLIFWAVIILLIIYWISKSWIAILIIGLIFSIWLIAQYTNILYS